MVEPYNLTYIANANGWVDYMLVFNYWSAGIWFTGICIVLALIIFGVAKYNLVPTPEAGTLACFFGFFVSSLFWIFTYNGLHSVFTFIPIMFLFGLGWGVWAIKANS